ncbi:hypothetical protein IWX49DRAFT_58484 [Phyllosticta citricarpa]|uniref:Uncharacterized protein n=2 Tax=Phyllosticta TaxID=121621 RepID=A0ABR1LFI4_9PEZI
MALPSRRGEEIKGECLMLKDRLEGRICNPGSPVSRATSRDVEVSPFSAARCTMKTTWRRKRAKVDPKGAFGRDDEVADIRTEKQTTAKTKANTTTHQTYQHTHLTNHPHASNQVPEIRRIHHHHHHHHHHHEKLQTNAPPIPSRTVQQTKPSTTPTRSRSPRHPPVCPLRFTSPRLAPPLHTTSTPPITHTQKRYAPTLLLLPTLLLSPRPHLHPNPSLSVVF